jgi:AcrR family transcriptional regulator
VKTMQLAQSPRRQLERGAYACGEQTRSRIVATALRIFGEHGYDQTSTRKIAAEAGVNPPALQYYFGSKEGLHRACAQFIIDRVRASLAPAFDAASKALASRSRAAARAVLYRILDTLSDSLASTDSDDWSRFIARGKTEGAGPAMPMIRERIGQPLIETTAKLVALLQGQAADAPTMRMRALLLLAPVSWIHANRESVLAVLGWDAFEDDRLGLVKDALREQVRAMARSPSGGRALAAGPLRRRAMR